jgi:hypothetical protein
MFSKAKETKVLSSFQSIETVNKKYKGVPFSLLGSQTSFQGKVILKGEARLAGQIEGTIISEDVLILEEPALIKGEYTDFEKKNFKGLSPNPMDSHWGGMDFTEKLIQAGYYKEEEVSIS